MANKYELMYIVAPEADEAKQKEISEKVKGLIESNGSTISQSDAWGKRDLATPINAKNQGIYFVIQYEGTGAANALLVDYFGINESVMRHMITRAEGLAEYKARKEELTGRPAK